MQLGTATFLCVLTISTICIFVLNTRSIVSIVCCVVLLTENVFFIRPGCY